jgi:hypothetical protein
MEGTVSWAKREEGRPDFCATAASEVGAVLEALVDIEAGTLVFGVNGVDEVNEVGAMDELDELDE